jgi:hypothetical protein
MAVYVGATPSGVKITGGGQITIDTCIMEADEAVGAVAGYGLWIVTGDYSYPINLIQVIADQIQIDYITRITSINCQFGDITLVGTDVKWISINDWFIDQDAVGGPTAKHWEDMLVLNPGTNYSVIEHSERGIKYHGVGITDFATLGAADHIVRVNGTQRGSIGEQQIIWGTGITNPSYEVNDGTIIGRLQSTDGIGVYLGSASDSDVYLIRDSAQKWQINSQGDLRSVGGGGIGVNALTWAAIGGLTPYAGFMTVCTDCTIGDCATSGTGALAVYIGSAFVCK